MSKKPDFNSAQIEKSQYNFLVDLKKEFSFGSISDTIKFLRQFYEMRRIKK